MEVRPFRIQPFRRINSVLIPIIELLGDCIGGISGCGYFICSKRDQVFLYILVKS